MTVEATTRPAIAPRTRRLGRLERPALAGVLVREVINFGAYWKSSTFSSIVDPTIYLLAFGFGFGSLVSTVAGYEYIAGKAPLKRTVVATMPVPTNSM